MRSNTEDTFPIVVEEVDGQGHIVVDAVSASDSFVNGLESSVSVKGPSDYKASLMLNQTAPGRYEGHFDLETYGSYIVEVAHNDPVGDNSASSKATLTWPYPDEYLTLEPNHALIAKTAEIGLGGVNPEPARLFDPEGEKVKFKSELWHWFLFAALGLWILDIVMRRLRLYGKTAIPWERVAGRS